MGLLEHQHIVPTGYLKLFSEDGMVEAHPVVGDPAKVISTRHAAVRKNFYSISRADGSRSTATEEALSEIENVGIPLLRTIADRWPLAPEDRAILGHYIALQVGRTPGWRRFFEPLRDGILDRQHAERADLGPEHWDRFVTHIQSDAHRAEAMWNMALKVGSLLASMHLTLLTFGPGALLTSDHPVACALWHDGVRTVEDALPEFGFANLPEFRFPVSHERALLFCWHDGADVAEDGSPWQARAINCSTKGQAEVHWFVLPGSRPAYGRGETKPLVSELYPEYLVGALEASQRRRSILEVVDSQVMTQEQVTAITVVTHGEPVTRGPIGGQDVPRRGQPEGPT